MNPANAVERHDHIRRAAWVGLIIAAGALFSFHFACAAPFAALAAIAAVNMTKRDAIAAVVGVWFVNQAIGFSVLGYPWDLSTLCWGAAILVAALLSLVAATAIATRFRDTFFATLSAATFFTAFVAYEAAIYVATVPLGGADAAFAWPVVEQVFMIDLVSLLGLVVLHRAALAIGLAAPARRRFATA
jgi:hypothetical protein